MNADHVKYLSSLKQRGFEPKVIYDIGACTMEWTRAAQMFWPNATYILFEAFQEHELSYKEAGFTYHIGVLSDTAGQARKFYYNTNENAMTGNSYYQEKNNKHLYENYRIIKADTLDEVVTQRKFLLPDLIKIDVQGAEKDVILGGRNVVKHAQHMIVEMQHVEYNDGAPLVSETLPWIESMGWKCVAPLFANNGADGDYGFERSKNGHKVAFYTNDLGIRGTQTVIWGYAWILKTMYGIEPMIISNPKCNVSSPLLIDDYRDSYKNWFEEEFSTDAIESGRALDDYLVANRVDVCYYVCAGNQDETHLIPFSIPTVVHCVFDGTIPFGTVHTTISEFVSRNAQSSTGYYPIVLPNVVFMDNTLDDLRDELHIPQDAIVFGRYGGYHQFDIPYVHSVVIDVAKTNPNIYFVFMNTHPFTANIPNIIYLLGTRNMNRKRRFVNTCDAMLHARSDGESFGCACGEFAICGKPVITCYAGFNAHIDILGSKAIIYHDTASLYKILTNPSSLYCDMMDNGYMQYIPTKVAPILKNIIDLAVSRFHNV